ncbi:MAG: hypothetical protein WC907_08455 [Acholeplasmataceae bacterium]|jgi:hypothetical protein
MTEIILADIAIGAAAGAIYGGAAYFKKREGENPEPFDMVKFGGTVIIGVGVGVALANTGVQVTDSAIQNGLMIGTTMGFTALIENGIRGLYRAITGKR